MKIYLMGFMGSGKSSIGKRLAKAMAFDFIDLDHFIEENASKSINKLFAEEGEEHFRTLERRTLIELRSKTNLVVATGGGTPCFHENMKFINETGISIYLKLNNDLLYQRLSKARSKRPLLINLSERELKTYITDKMSERLPYYEQAQHIVDAAHITNTTEQISQLIQDKKLL